jgi:hypothetical protein
MTHTRAPADLAADGRALWCSIGEYLEREHLTLDAHEEPLVVELCRTVDRIATCRAALTALEPTEAAWTRLASEERQQRLAYGRIIGTLGWPTGIVEQPADAPRSIGLSPASRRGTKAARSRWDRVNGAA